MNRPKKGIKYFFSAATLFFYGLKSVFAQSAQLTVDFTGANPIKAENFTVLVKGILDFIVDIGTLVVVFFVIYSGFLFVTAQGNDDKITKAKKAFTWTIVGSVVLLGAWALSQVVCRLAVDLGASNISCN